jgi:integrase
MAGIPVVQLKHRGASYQLYYYTTDTTDTTDKIRRRLSVGSDQQQAHRLKVKFEQWLLDGKDPEREMEKAKEVEAARSITLRELFPVFLNRHGRHQSRSMQDIYHYRFQCLLRSPALVEVPIGDITRRLMLDYMNARIEMDGVKPATVNREAALVKNMLFRAVEWDMIDRNPLQGMRLLSEGDKRRVELSTEQSGKLLIDLPDSISDIVEFALYSGLRKENILDMRIEQIRFDDINEAAEVTLVVKGGRTETFPLAPLAVELLMRIIGTRRKGYVFINPRTGTRYKHINKTFDRAVRKVELMVEETKFRFHDLRHAFATNLLRNGATLDEVRELMGHRDRSTTDRYATINRKDAGKVLSFLPKIEKARIASSG